MVKHDENKDVRILSRKCVVNPGTKTIKASRNNPIGIKSWARIDYLCHYCGYHFLWENVILDKTNYEDSDKKKDLRNTKKALKEHKLTDKTRRTSNRQ